MCIPASLLDLFYHISYFYIFSISKAIYIVNKFHDILISLLFAFTVLLESFEYLLLLIPKMIWFSWFLNCCLFFLRLTLDAQFHFFSPNDHFNSINVCNYNKMAVSYMEASWSLMCENQHWFSFNFLICTIINDLSLILIITT